MSDKIVSRRTFLRTSLTTAAALPIGIPLVVKADGHRLGEEHPTAVALGYKHDTAAVDGARFPQHKATQMCKNCQLYQPADANWGACAIFPGKQVNTNGWCSAWVVKQG